MKDWIHDGEELETNYVQGTDADFLEFIKSFGDKANVKSIDGHARWVIEREDGTKYIARPQSAHEVAS